MKNTKRKIEYRLSQTSWRYFTRQLDIQSDSSNRERLNTKILIQILKELQYLNEK